MNAQLTVNLTKLPCDWCEGAVPAPHRLMVDGWSDYACTEHGRAYYPTEFARKDTEDRVVARAQELYREWEAKQNALPWRVKAWRAVRSTAGFLRFLMGR